MQRRAFLLGTASTLVGVQAAMAMPEARRVLFGRAPAWVPNPANPPDIAINWKTNQAWKRNGGLTSPASLGVSTSRASVKQVLGSGGQWTQVASNVTAQSDLGRSTEEARTNGIRNNTMAAAVVADGVERITNGNFALNPVNASINTIQNGWQWKVNGGTGTVVWNGSSAVTLTGDGANAAVISGSLTTVIGLTYTITADITGNTGNVQAGGAAYSTALLNVTSGTTTGQKFQFVATATTTFVSFFHSQATATVIANVSVQSAGQLPTNWLVTSGAGLLTTVAGLGTDSGIDYIDLTIAGTSTGTTYNLAFEVANNIAAVIGQTWTGSLFASLVGGSFTNMASIRPNIFSYTSVPASLTQYSATLTLPTSAALGTQRFPVNATITDATAAFVRGMLLMVGTNGAAINYTLRIGWPQLENNSISGTVASASKVADGTGGVNSTGVYSIAGTGTLATLNCTWAGGVLTVNSVASAGSYTVFPVAGAALTYVSGAATGWTGATVNSVPTNLAANAFVTSPIKTTGAAATRAADVTTLAATFGAAYSLYTQFTPQAPLVAFANQNVLQFDDGTGTQRTLIRRSLSTGGFTVAQIGGSGGSPNPSGTLAQNVSGKVAGAFAAGAQAGVFNGGTVATAAGASLPSTPTTIHFGVNSGNGEQLNGLAAIEAFWFSQAVPNAELKNMTTP